MKNIAVLSGDKRQIYANSYLNNNGLCSYIKNNFDFNEDVTFYVALFFQR